MGENNNNVIFKTKIFNKIVIVLKSHLFYSLVLSISNGMNAK